MDLKFDRRAVLKTVGAALAGGVSACTTKPAEPAAVVATTTKVNLICHGMMLFWYDQERPDRYRILIPQNTSTAHELRMGSKRFEKRRLTHGKPKDATRYFTLSFGVKEVLKPRAMRDGTSNVAFYPLNGVIAKPTYGTPKDGGVAVVIDIPYPEDVWFERTETYGGQPYVLDDGASAFDIKPKQIPRTTIFQFTVEDTAQDIVLLEGNGRVYEKFYPGGTMSPFTNLYLYNQPLKPEHYGMVHTGDFSQMLKYGPTGKENDVVLKLSNNAQVTCMSTPKGSTAHGWEADDMKALAEIESKMLICDFPKMMFDKGVNDFDKRGIDLAACIQGWGS